ncbi:MAG: GldG family protein [Planctomycetota bacterium]
MKGATFTRWTRLALSGQVVLLVGLVLAAVLLVIQVSESPDLRVRADFSESRSGSLDPATASLLRQLPSRAEVDVFFRSEPELDVAMGDAFSRAKQLFALVEDVSGGMVSVRYHDANDLARSRARLAELRVDPEELVTNGWVLAACVVRVGERRTILRFFPDMGSIVDGDAARGEVPRLVDWRGEEAFAEALGRVSGDRSPKLVFVQGNGEATETPGDDGGVGGLMQLLQLEGFEVVVWEPARRPRVPEGADVVVLPGTSRPFPASVEETLRAFVDDGGRLFATSSGGAYDGDGGLGSLLASFGARLLPGVACEEYFDPSFGDWFEGDPRCADLTILPDGLASGHPVTEPLREFGRTLRFRGSQTFDRGEVPRDGTSVDLVRSSGSAWRDIYELGGVPDHRREPGREEVGRQTLGVALEWPGTERKARVVALGTTLALTKDLEHDRDLVVNAFDWLTDRDYRVRVAPKDPFEARIEKRTSALAAAVVRSAWLGVPGACALVGLVLVFLRRR